MSKENTQPVGAFLESLKRNNSKIRADRAAAIGETCELKYRRVVEDLNIEIQQLKRDRDNMLDLSPTNADSLIVAADFKADAFIAKDLEIGVRLRNLEIKLDIAQKRYQYLFGVEDTTGGIE